MKHTDQNQDDPPMDEMEPPLTLHDLITQTYGDEELEALKVESSRYEPSAEEKEENILACKRILGLVEEVCSMEPDDQLFVLQLLSQKFPPHAFSKKEHGANGGHSDNSDAIDSMDLKEHCGWMMIPRVLVDFPNREGQLMGLPPRECEYGSGAELGDLEYLLLARPRWGMWNEGGHCPRCMVDMVASMRDALCPLCGGKVSLT